MHKLVKGKWLILWISLLLVASVAVTLFLCIKNVQLDEGLTVRLVFGRMSENDCHRVLDRAEDYLREDDLSACRRLANFVADHGGEYADDGLLMVARAFHKEGDLDGAYETLSLILDKYAGGSAVGEAEFGNLVTKSVDTLLEVTPLDISRVGKFIRLLGESESPYFPEVKKKFDACLSEKQDLVVEYVYESKKPMVLKSDAVKDAKAEALFFSKKETPNRMIEKIHSLVLMEGIIDESAIDAYVRENLIYDTQIDEVVRAPSIGGEITPTSTEGEFEKQDYGYVAKVRCLGRIENFSLAGFFAYAHLDPYELANFEPKETSEIDQ